MNRITKRLILFVFAVSSFAIVGSAQQKASEVAYQSWTAQRSADAKTDLSAGHLAVAFAVARYQEVGMSVDISVFAGADVTQLPSLEFIAQPVATEKASNGSVNLIEVGNPATIKSSRSEVLMRTLSGAVLQPELIARVPNNATGVRISVKGFGSSDQGFTVILPLRNEFSTAVIAKAARCDAQSSNTCE